MSLEPHLPTAVGFDALAELDRVDWSALHHAYGQGVDGCDLSGDVAGSLALLPRDPQRAMQDGLWSNVCHQGTVYDATAYALPFVAAVAAGDVPAPLRSQLAVLIGEIALNGCVPAPSGTHSGAYGEGVVPLILRTMERCGEYLDALNRIDPELTSLVAAIRRLTADPSDVNRQELDDILDPKD